MCATAASSCLKEVCNYDKKLFLDDVDAQGIKLFMLSHKVIEGEDGPRTGADYGKRPGKHVEHALYAGDNRKHEL